MEPKRAAAPAAATGSTDVHALVRLHPDGGRQTRSWQTPRLRFPKIVLQDAGQGRWTGQLGFLVRLEGRSAEDLVAQLYERHGIEARLDLEPVAA
ncbi:MAG: hypothetical protein QOI63_877 [Thermoplasmata archaeon]|jgi:hypothetical protein|nr:hypothetical protein [Thermoplasmata archaeon]